MYERLGIVALAAAALFIFLSLRIMNIAEDEKYAEAGARQQSYTLTLSSSYGNIYDCRLRSFTNSERENIAVVNPAVSDIARLLPYIADKEEFSEKLRHGSPFFCEISEPVTAEGILSAEIPKRYSEKQSAQHIIGYSRDGQGVSGLERSFDEFLHSFVSRRQAVFTLDGLGEVRSPAELRLDGEIAGGVVTTLDRDLQRIAESVFDEYIAAGKAEKGAVVILDPYTCEIKAMLSRPDFSVYNLSESMDDENSPFINRALTPYSVGSAFKLSVAAAALDSGISEDFTYDCRGSIDIDGTEFHCHNRDGHGELDMKGAVRESCNTYFIALTREMSPAILHDKAALLGFGKSFFLADGLVSPSGSLQDAEQLENAGERANFSFGQGALSATPLQVAVMTCAFANGGRVGIPSLIKGTTSDGITIDGIYERAYINAVTPPSAEKIRTFMMSAAMDKADSLACPAGMTAAAKTSTAQTGRYDEHGDEITESWITGFFPAENPLLTITVLVEDGKGGNKSAAPIFCDIIEKIAAGE